MKISYKMLFYNASFFILKTLVCGIVLGFSNQVTYAIFIHQAQIYTGQYSRMNGINVWARLTPNTKTVKFKMASSSSIFLKSLLICNQQCHSSTAYFLCQLVSSRTIHLQRLINEWSPYSRIDVTAALLPHYWTHEHQYKYLPFYPGLDHPGEQ